MAGVSGIPEGERLREEGEETLEEACASQFLSDGGHASRSPLALYEAFCDLIAADDALVRSGVETPQLIRDALPRMATMLRFFRMSDGRLACFNGGRGRVGRRYRRGAARDRGRTRLQLRDAIRLPAARRRDVTVLMDVGGAPPPAYGERAHAGALAFEFSCGPDRLIVNVGSGIELLPDWRAAGRATNGHSTLSSSMTRSPRPFSQRRAGRGAAHHDRSPRSDRSARKKTTACSSMRTTTAIAPHSATCIAVACFSPLTAARCGGRTPPPRPLGGARAQG